MIEDERAKEEGVCRTKITGPSGIEWICVVKVTSDEHEFPRHVHYFVNRWPRRTNDIQKEADS